MKFLVFGCNGMAGHMVSIYLSEQGHEVEGFARAESPFVKTIVGDARDIALVEEVLKKGCYTAVVNCIGVLNESAENDHEAAVFLNAYFPQFLAKSTEGTSTQVIHISTDCVFSGKRGSYAENDFPDGEFFYDRSKALGELANEKDVTFRNSIVGPDINKAGIGLVNWFMQQKSCVKGYKNAIWTGQTTLQLAKTVQEAAMQHVYGLYNMVPAASISKYDMLVLFNQYLRKEPVDIIPEHEVRVDKSLKRTNYKRFHYSIPGYKHQIQELGVWMREHRGLYPHYEL